MKVLISLLHILDQTLHHHNWYNQEFIILEDGEYQTLNMPCTNALLQVHLLKKSMPLLILKALIGAYYNSTGKRELWKMVSPLILHRTEWGDDTVLVAVCLMNVSQLDTLSYYYNYYELLI